MAKAERKRGHLQATLRSWDAGTRVSRMRQLDDFIARCADMTGPQLEDELENGASLLLARVSSWLRLSYALGHSVATQLQAVSIFVAASSGQRFLAEFVEVGGVATVIEILSLPQLPEEDKHQSVRLLQSIVSAGRHYKEIVCEGEGVEAVEGFMTASKSEALLEDAVRARARAREGDSARTREDVSTTTTAPTASTAPPPPPLLWWLRLASTGGFASPALAALPLPARGARPAGPTRTSMRAAPSLTFACCVCVACAACVSCASYRAARPARGDRPR